MHSFLSVVVLTAAGLASANPPGMPFSNGTDVPFPFPNNTVPLLPNATLPNTTFPNGTITLPNITRPVLPKVPFPNVTTLVLNDTTPLLPNTTIPPFLNDTIPRFLNETFFNTTFPNGTITLPNVTRLILPTAPFPNLTIPILNDTVPLLPNVTIPPFPNNTIPRFPNETFLNATLPNGTATLPHITRSVLLTTAPFPNTTIPILNETIPLLPNATLPPFPNTTIPHFPNATFPNASAPLFPNSTNLVLPRDELMADAASFAPHIDGNNNVTFVQYVDCMVNRYSILNNCPRPAWLYSTKNKEQCAFHPNRPGKCIIELDVQEQECWVYHYQGGPYCAPYDWARSNIYKRDVYEDKKWGGRAFRYCMSHRESIEESCTLPSVRIKEVFWDCFRYYVPDVPLPEQGCFMRDWLEYHLCSFYSKIGGPKDCLAIRPDPNAEPPWDPIRTQSAALAGETQASVSRIIEAPVAEMTGAPVAGME